MQCICYTILGGFTRRSGVWQLSHKHDRPQISFPPCWSSPTFTPLSQLSPTSNETHVVTLFRALFLYENSSTTYDNAHYDDSQLQNCSQTLPSPPQASSPPPNVHRHRPTPRLLTLRTSYFADLSPPPRPTADFHYTYTCKTTRSTQIDFLHTETADNERQRAHYCQTKSLLDFIPGRKTMHIVIA